MPERQSSPGEVTARPDTGPASVAPDSRTNGHTEGGADRRAAATAMSDAQVNGVAADERTAGDPDGSVANGSSDSAAQQGAAQQGARSQGARSQGADPDGATATVAQQVAEQAEAEPEAVEPARAQPGQDAGAAAGPVADGPELAAEHPAPHGSAASSVDATVAAQPRPAPGPDADESPTVATAALTRRPTNDGMESWFASADAESTQVMPRAAAAPPPGPAPRGVDAPTERIQMPATPTPADAPPESSSGEGGSPRRKRVLFAAGAVAVLGLLYGGDLLFSSGSVPRGTTVAGVPVGGLSLADAEQKLRTQVGPRTTEPVAVTVGQASSRLDPRTAGLAVDWSATLDRAGSQPLNPVTRVTSLFTSRDVGVATSADRTALASALAQLAPIVDRAPVEGTVKFEGATPVPVNPVAGQKLDAAGAATVLERDWANGGTIALPLIEIPATTTPENVSTAIEKVAQPAVSGPLAVLGEGGAKGVLEPEAIASALTFRPDPAAGLLPEINQAAVTDVLKPQLAESEKPGRDAALDFSTGKAVVVPSRDGRGVDYEATLKDLLPVLTGTGPREITAVYADQPAKLTTQQLEGLGISGVIGEFQTGGFAADSGQNIKRAAEQINGRIVQPGETFSLNAATNPRDAAHGYVEAGIIENGHSARGIGGGVSQVATTLYNASYFAGMTNVEHKEHSFYISRYPAGREATVFDDIIDLKFRNDNPTAIMIQTAWTPSSLTVRIVGTKVWDVTSESGPRTNPTNPHTITIPAGEQCTPSKGAPGFTITNTRTLKNVETGEVRSDPTRTVKYNPSPIVNCG
jgi:vancomycin resistance protein YoaR